MSAQYIPRKTGEIDGAVHTVGFREIETTVLAGCAENLRNRSLLQKLQAFFGRNWLAGFRLQPYFIETALARSEWFLFPRTTLYTKFVSRKKQ
jgi:hypothetical protein